MQRRITVDHSQTASGHGYITQPCSGDDHHPAHWIARLPARFLLLSYAMVSGCVSSIPLDGLTYSLITTEPVHHHFPAKLASDEVW